MLKKLAIIGSAAVILSGCNALNPRYGSYNHLLNKDADSYCDSFGCGQDLAFYPMAQDEAERRAKACNWDWGTTSSAHAPGTPEYERLRAQEQSQGTVPGYCE